MPKRPMTLGYWKPGDVLDKTRCRDCGTELKVPETTTESYRKAARCRVHGLEYNRKAEEERRKLNGKPPRGTRRQPGRQAPSEGTSSLLDPYWRAFLYSPARGRT